MKIYITLFTILFISSLTLAQEKADAIVGQYWTETKGGKIEIYKKGNAYFGKIVWREDAIKDTENPDESLRDRSVIGMEFMTDFVYRNKKWVDGKVYSFENGGTYSGKMWLEDGGATLKMRGFLGISLLGKTATFNRAD